MKEKEEFFVPYINGSLGKRTKTTLVWFSISVFLVAGLFAFAFSYSQNEFKNSTFELSTETKLVGTYHESPYPMLRVKFSDSEYKNVVLLGFGKSGVNPYLKNIKNEYDNIEGMTLSIEGNLIYYNGKTLIQVTNEDKITVEDKRKSKTPESIIVRKQTFTGEIVDPKCYFGVMKPGYGKIHRSCAILCISGGIPPVLVTTDNNAVAKYLLVTDLSGKPIHQDILDDIGKPISTTGIVEKIEDWHILKLDVNDNIELDLPSSIY